MVRASRPGIARSWLAAGFFLAAAFGPARAAAAPEAPGEELWFLLELDGRPAGWAVDRWWHEAGTVVTESELSLRVARGAATVEVELVGRFEETEDGEPLVLRTRQALGSAPIETTYRFTPVGVLVESVQSGRRRSERIAAPEGEWLTPAEARQAVAAHHAAGDREYALRSVDPLEGLEPVTERRTWLGDATGTDAPGGVGRWRIESSSAPGVASVAILDATGEVIRSSTELLGLEATLRQVDRQTALAAGRERPEGNGALASPGPEVMVSTLVRPDRPIPDARGVHEAVYELSLSEGEMPELPSVAAQRVERHGDRLRVTVRADGIGSEPPAVRAPVDADPVPGAPSDPRLVAPSLYLDHEDPEVRRLLEVALAGPDDADPGPAVDPGRWDDGGPGALARVLTAFVHGYVDEKGLDTGFATASEVARSRRGDCTEHAVLLAALLRAAGIPSRAVMGLVYLDRFAGAEEVFGYHMWVQAYVDGGWLDLDPALAWGFDATHVALGVSDLSGPEGGAAFDRMLPLVGKLRIEIVKLER